MAPESSETRLVDPLSPVPANGDHWFVPGSSLVMRSIQRVIADIAPTDIPVQVVGEPGTGKEVLALHIHRLSHRRDQTFHKLSCANLGAATLHRFLVGAGDGPGKSVARSGGTVFLDEIADLDASCQSVLLDFFADCDELPASQPPDARLICATSCNLEERMRSGHFREELYFRMNGICLRLPPLRHRKADIPGFLNYFLRKSAAHFGRPQPTLSSWAMRMLLDYSWPGNVRELEATMEKIVAFGDEGLGLAELQRSGLDLPRPERAPMGISLKEAARAASRRAERELMLKVLTRTRWNRKLASRELQISYKALLYKLKLLGLEDSASS